MRIAYIAPYQGLELVQRRPSLRNLSLAARVKIELIAELLQQRSHGVEILSQGEIIEPQLKFYPGFREPETSFAGAPVHYASAFPVRYLNGFWSSASTLRLLRQRHRARAFDLVVIYNLKPPQVACARHAMRRWGLPVVLEYEDDQFVNVTGRSDTGFTSRWHLAQARHLRASLSGCLAVSPYLLAQVPPDVPKLLLRGVVGDAVLKAGAAPSGARSPRVVFSGTHDQNQGLIQLVTAWKSLALPDWELHLAGQGPITSQLRELAGDDARIVFHGLLNKEQNARLLGSARIGMNPHNPSRTPGNVFAFKIVEYMAAGLHVITTPMGTLEPEMETGISYLPDNSAATIAARLREVIGGGLYRQNAQAPALRAYGPEAVAQALDQLLQQVVNRNHGSTAAKN